MLWSWKGMGPWIDPAPEREDHLSSGIALCTCLPWDETEIFESPQTSSGLGSPSSTSHEAWVAYVFLFPFSGGHVWLREGRSLHQGRNSCCLVWSLYPSVFPVRGTGQPLRYVEKNGRKECNLSKVQLCLTPPSPLFTLYSISDFSDLSFVWGLFLHFYYSKTHVA